MFLKYYFLSGYQNSVDVTLTGVLVQGKHTDFVTNGNLTTLSVIQVTRDTSYYGNTLIN